MSPLRFDFLDDMIVHID